MNKFSAAGVIFGAAVLDLTTKAWARSMLHEAHPLELLPFFDLTLSFNRGVSFGLFQNAPSVWPVIVLSALVTAVVIFWLWRSPHRLEQLGLSLIVGGAIGNLIDRLQNGAVTDFLDFHVRNWHWPAFNLADTAIVCGVLLLFLEMFQGRRDASTIRRA